MSHLMIDFETLATTPNAQVLSLGAVIERAGHDRKEGHWFFSQNNQHRHVDPATEAWWIKQSNEARMLFDDCATKGISLDQFLDEFTEFIQPAGKLQVWGNGATFDVSIIEHIFRSKGRKIPWQFWNVRCYRTIKACHPSFGLDIPFKGVKHNALDDARHQMDCLLEWLRR